MQYLLDANVVIALMSSKESQLSRRARTHHPYDIGISSVVIHELYYGAFKSQRQEHNVERVDRLMFEVVPFDNEDARQAGLVRATLAKEGTPIGPYDVLIAGQAIARDLTLITHNTSEFARVAGLRIEDWEA